MGFAVIAGIHANELHLSASFWSRAASSFQLSGPYTALERGEEADR
jgi:hypothetical protein